MDNCDLDGKVAIVTGGSRGIGAAVARAYVRAGARVVISGRKQEGLDVAAAALNDEVPGSTLAVAAHAGRPEETRRLVQETIARFGRLDIAVNNAATNPHFGPLMTATESQWDKILEVNVKGYFWLCQMAAQQMRAQGSGGKIINMASVAALMPGTMMGIYSVSKAAVVMLTKVLAVELAADNIQVNAIAPGYIKTRFSSALWDNPVISAGIISSTPAGRIGEPDEVVGAALYLASPAANFTTGIVLTVDGGQVLT